MTATGVLRRLLDERGVEWMPCAWEPQTETFYKNGDGVAFIATESTAQNGFLLRTDMPVTPEQAIAATLGNDDAYTREDVESAFVSGYSLGTMPVGSDPQWDENKQTVDEHMAELGWFRAATLGDTDATCERHGDADERDQLKTENAKLWELITDVHESLKADKAGMFHNLTLSAMEDDMRELGIEVDG